MRLHTIAYKERVGTPLEWTLEGLELGAKNLIVGKNAAGKTRALNLIASLAANLSGRAPITDSSDFHCHFKDGERDYRFQCEFRETHVVREILEVGGKTLLDRGVGGAGFIWAEEQQQMVKFQSPTELLVSSARRDQIQHPFLEPLFQWATSLRHYRFGSSLGKETFAIISKDPQELDEHDSNRVIGMFRQGRRLFDDKFLGPLLSDLRAVGYDVTSIDVLPPYSIRFQNAPVEPVALSVQEADLPGPTDQVSMSQGMWRVISLLVNLHYSRLKNPGACVVIDDIGEGLDFDRSCRLIEVLRKMAEHADIQLVMATNDRFIMNQVPLEEWSVLQRNRNHVTVRNYKNSRELFESFKFTGLSNFSFLELDFVNTPPEELR